MLKIKDNVDLKKLEKFGFYKNKTRTAYWYDLKQEIHFYEDMEYECNYWLGVYIKDRKLRFVNDIKCDKGLQLAFSVERLNVIFDLIQADMVEKVDV